MEVEEGGINVHLYCFQAIGGAITIEHSHCINFQDCGFIAVCVRMLVGVQQNFTSIAFLFVFESHCRSQYNFNLYTMTIVEDNK